MRAALYARFSTDLQSDRSIPDQLRDCERIAARHGFRVVARFHDAGISGGTARRPGYAAMLEAARRGDLDVIVAEDISRLWRNMAEQAPRLAELYDLGVHVVTHDLDTRQESAAILGAVLGASNETYRREIARRTRRGLEGLARQGKHTGGRAYGFDGLDVIEAEAAIVREIFERYGGGESMRSIALDLNRRGIPSPGATWRRRERATDGRWRVSALHAILKNERYIGRVIWNRYRWIRSAADSRRRTRVENPRSEWIINEGPVIIDRRTWDRVRARMVTGFPSPKARPKFLLSGLLECGVCGGKMTITGRGHRRRYVCANRHTGAGCDNDLGVSRELAEELILRPVIAELTSPEAEARLLRNLRRMKPRRRTDPRIEELRRLVADGVLSEEEAAPAIARLRAAEQEDVQPNVFEAAEEYRRTVRELRTALEQEDIAAARPILRDWIGTVRAVPTVRGGKRFLTAHFSASDVASAMVAGAGFVCTFERDPVELIPR